MTELCQSDALAERLIESLCLQVKHTIDQLSLPPQRLWVGFSGGVDSTVLLEATRTLYPKHTHAIHVNHQLSPHARDWVQHCQSICDQRQVPLTIKSVLSDKGAGKGAGKGLEAHLRALRYQAFESVMSAQDVLLLAHHLDDQAETLLLRLCRGTGVAGAGSMRTFSRRILSQRVVTIVRPWLGVSKAVLAEVAQQLNLQWVEDDSNQSERFDRNFIRHQVLPVIEKRWPAAKRTLARFATLAQQSQQVAGLPLERWSCITHDVLDVAVLSGLSLGQQTSLIHQWLQFHRQVAPSAQLIQSVLILIRSQRQYSCVDWSPNQVAVQIIYFNKSLWLVEPERVYQGGQTLFVDCGERLEIVYIQSKKYAALAMSFEQVRRLRVVDHPDYRGKGVPLFEQSMGASKVAKKHLRLIGHHSWKKFFQSHRVPKWLREAWPLVYQQDCLVAVPHLWVHPEWRTKTSEMGWQIRSLEPGIKQWLKHTKT